MRCAPPVFSLTFAGVLAACGARDALQQSASAASSSSGVGAGAGAGGATAGVGGTSVTSSVGGASVTSGVGGASVTSSVATASSSSGCSGDCPFACGSMMCAGGSYCVDQPGGIPIGGACTTNFDCVSGWCSGGICQPPPDGGTAQHAYDCRPLPASCVGAPSCACIGAALPSDDTCSPKLGATCTEDGSGHVTVHCVGI
jgi:hypothetical protein